MVRRGVDAVLRQLDLQVLAAHAHPIANSSPTGCVTCTNLWHVLTGYGMDEAGEAALLAFNLGQVPNCGMALIVAASAVIGPKDLRLSFPRYLLQAWRRGRRTPMLSVAPYERLLAQPLDEVRLLLNIQPARAAHPEGILVGNRARRSNRWTLEALAR